MVALRDSESDNGTEGVCPGCKIEVAPELVRRREVDNEAICRPCLLDEDGLLLPRLPCVAERKEEILSAEMIEELEGVQVDDQVFQDGGSMVDSMVPQDGWLLIGVDVVSDGAPSDDPDRIG